MDIEIMLEQFIIPISWKLVVIIGTYKRTENPIVAIDIIV